MHSVNRSLHYLHRLRDWAPLSAVLCILVISTVYALSQVSRASGGIQEAGDLGERLDVAAREALSTVVSPNEARAIRERKQELETCIRECQQPALLVAELTESARAVGLQIQEIKPLGSPGIRPVSDDRQPSPRHLIAIVGGYAQIAEYLELIETQRLQVRVTAVTVRPHESGSAMRRAMPLIAHVTVEPLRYTGADEEGGPAP